MKFLVRWIGLIGVGVWLLAPGPAFSADESSPAAGSAELANPFSDFVPFEDEFDVDEAERFMYFGRFFAISLGSGFQTFAGNMGKLYNTALPVLDFRLIYFFDFRLAGQVTINSASHAFTAYDVGNTSVNLLRASFDLKHYFDTQEYGAIVTSLSPYVIAGAGPVFRTQSFSLLGTTAKDTSLGISVGGGLEYTLKPRKTSIGLEGRVHQIFFRDRNDDTYIESKIPDTTGPMFSLITNFTFYF